MKILQITSLYLPHIGGIENHVYNLSRKLVERGHDVSVYTSNIPRNKNYEVINGIKIHRFNSLYSPLNNQVSPSMLLKLLKNNDFDIIHAHGHLQLTTNFAAISSIIKNTPLIITSHGTVEYSDWKQLINFVYNKTIGLWTMKCAETVIALSPSQSCLLKEMGVEQIKIVPNGVNINYIRNSENSNEFRQKYDLDDKKIILYVGSLIPRKGLDYLIDAMFNVRDNVVLVIIGDSLEGTQTYKEKLLDKIHSQYMNNVIFTGKVDDETLRSAYHEADIFVLPSISEGLPTVLLEAMVHKKAIVAFDIPGNNDLIVNNENGFLVEPRNIEKLSEAINSLIDNPIKKAEFGENGHKKANQLYDWNKISISIESIYNQCLLQ